MSLALVVAVARNGVIGRDGGLPWRLSTDLRRFRALTIGHPVVMGRRTWESLSRRPLPERTNIVVTRARDFSPEGALVAHSVDEALRVARAAPGGEAVQVIGGGQIYAATMPLADRLDVTHVLADAEGDTLFPRIDPGEWEEISGENVPAGPKDDHATRYALYLRRPKA